MNLLFDEKSQKLIVQAKKEMYELKHPYVGSEHLFLAILRDEDLDITKLLNKWGIFYFNFKEEIIKIIGIGNISNDDDWDKQKRLLAGVCNIVCHHRQCADPDECRRAVPAMYAEGCVDGLQRLVEHVFSRRLCGEFRCGER